MFYNCFFDGKKNKIHLWEYVRGKTSYLSMDWVPYVFIQTNNGDVKTIYGDGAVKRTFPTYFNYMEFVENNFCLENKVKPEIQFLTERYHSVSDDKIEIPPLKIYYIDIEVYADRGKSWKVENPEGSIVLISVYDNSSNTTNVFGIKPYNGKYAKESFVKYHLCNSEEDLLMRFIKFMERNPCHVISGWNISGFDIPYIINRIKVVFGEDTGIYNKLSPINIVRYWYKNKKYSIDIAGVSVLDMIDLYKWFSPNKLESYSLEFVSQFELEKGKVDYSEYKNLRELFEQNWDLYVTYNIIDALRVHQMEEKLGYIKQVQSLSLLTRVPMKYYHTQTALLEGLFLTYIRRNNMCAPHLYGGTQETYEGAFVKEPQKGKFEWVCDLDIVSSYPTSIITLNMSPETYFGRILYMTEEEVINHTKTGKFPEFTYRDRNGVNHKMNGDKLSNFNKAIKKRLLCIAPCGSVFITKPVGTMAMVEQYLFKKRIDVKNMMIKTKSSLPSLRGKNLENAQKKIAEYNSLQNSYKILLNSMYGATAVPYSRWYNKNISEAVTSASRNVIKSGISYVNEIMNDNNSKLVDIVKEVNRNYDTFQRTTNKDYVIYCDTDSIFINMGGFFNEMMGDVWNAMSDDIKIHYIKKAINVITEYVNNRAYSDVQRKMHNCMESDFRIKFKQEMIAKTAIFLMKKKYSVWCIDEEGVPVDTIKTTGLEIVRSDTPEAIRPMLKSVMEMILKSGDEGSLSIMINEYKKNLYNVEPEEIAVNTGVSNIDKYIENGVTKKGTPWHVKGVINYNTLTEAMGIKDKYEDISEGEKIKVVYTLPNSYNISVLSFKRWPSEFKGIIAVDYNKMIDKYFTEKVRSLLEPLNMSRIVNHNNISSLESLFS